MKPASDHFRKMIQREQGIVRNAVLAGVQDLILDTSTTHAEVSKNLAVTQRLDRTVKDVITSTRRTCKHLGGIIVSCLYQLFIN